MVSAMDSGIYKAVAADVSRRTSTQPYRLAPTNVGGYNDQKDQVSRGRP
jgi:hypothetical protein